jgi:hypothetical protein
MNKLIDKSLLGESVQHWAISITEDKNKVRTVSYHWFFELLVNLKVKSYPKLDILDVFGKKRKK